MTAALILGLQRTLPADAAQARRRVQDHRGGRRVKPRKRGSFASLRPSG